MIFKKNTLKNLARTNLLAVCVISIIVQIFFSSCKSSKNSLSAKENSALSEKDKIALMEEFMDGTREKISGNFDKASSHFQKCLKMDKNNSAAMYELATIYEYQRKDALALNMMKTATSIDGQNEWYRLLDCTGRGHHLLLR